METDFEKYLSNALKQHGYLFPETDSQMTILEKSLEDIPLPQEFESPDFVFSGNRKKHSKIIKFPTSDNTEGEYNWAIAARDGKEISDALWAEMRKDKEDARKNQNRTE